MLYCFRLALRQSFSEMFWWRTPHLSYNPSSVTRPWYHHPSTGKLQSNGDEEQTSTHFPDKSLQSTQAGSHNIQIRRRSWLHSGTRIPGVETIQWNCVKVTNNSTQTGSYNDELSDIKLTSWIHRLNDVILWRIWYRVINSFVIITPSEIYFCIKFKDE